MKPKISGIPFDEIKKIELQASSIPTVVTPTMKALVYKGSGEIELKDVPIPAITKSTDALIKVLKTTICGTDLGILKGKVPTVKPGTTLGHEGVGVIEQVGTAVRNFKKGDHVIIPVLPRTEPVNIARSRCMPIAKMGAGYWETPLTVPKLNMYLRRMLTTASILFLLAPMRKPLLC